MKLNHLLNDLWMHATYQFTARHTPSTIAFSSLTLQKLIFDVTAACTALAELKHLYRMHLIIYRIIECFTCLIPHLPCSIFYLQYLKLATKNECKQSTAVCHVCSVCVSCSAWVHLSLFTNLPGPIFHSLFSCFALMKYGKTHATAA